MVDTKWTFVQSVQHSAAHFAHLILWVNSTVQSNCTVECFMACIKHKNCAIFRCTVCTLSKTWQN